MRDAEDSPLEFDLDEWLTRATRETRAADISPRQRPLAAIARLEAELGISVTIPPPLSTAIFAWFAANVAEDPGAAGYFDGCFYFDARFWRLSMPLIRSGPRRVCLWDSITDMPEPVQLGVDADALAELGETWPVKATR